MGIEVSASPPWLRARFVVSATDEEFHAYLDAVTQRLERWDMAFGRCVLLNLVEGGFRSTEPQNQLQTRWVATQRPLIDRVLAGRAFVIPDPFVRSVTTSILRLNPRGIPYTVCESESEAQQWGQRILAGQRLR